MAFFPVCGLHIWLNRKKIEITFKIRHLRLGNQGSILPLVLIITPITAILIASLINVVLTSRKQSAVSSERVTLSVTLDGIIDYTTYALKSQWCMTADWQKASAADCNLSHPRSFERLVMDNNTIQGIRSLNKNVTGFETQDIQLKEFSVQLDLQNLPVGHPLKVIMDNLSGEIKSFAQVANINVSRIDNANVPQRGRESNVFISVNIHPRTLVDPIFARFVSVTARSRLIITPRELNYFSLVVPHDLYLDGRAPASTGDISLPQVSSPGTSAGLVFDGPVFVNGDIFLPDGSSPRYTAATFSQQVVMGGSDGQGSGGRVMAGTAPYAPKTYGGKSEDIYYSLIKNMGGFKSGIDTDGRRDRGLDFIFSPAGPTNATAMDRCIYLNQIRTDLSLTKQSALLVKYNSPPVEACDGTCTPGPGTNNISNLSFLVALPGGDFFFPQDVSPARYTNTVNPIVPLPHLGGTFTRGPTGSRSIMTMGLSIHSKYATPSGALAQEKVAFGYDSDIQFSSGDRTMPTAQRANPTVDIKVSRYAGADGKDLINFAVVNITAKGKISELGDMLKLEISAFDLAYWAGRDRRQTDANTTETSYDPGYTRTAVIDLDARSGFLRLKSPLADTMDGNWSYANQSVTPGKPADPNNPSNAKNLQDEMAACGIYLDKTRDVSGGSFAAANWETANFTPTTRFSWYFAPTTPNSTAASYKPYNFLPAGNATLIVQDATASQNFQVASIASKCIVPATVNFFAGFYVCDQMIIEARSQALEFIGTIIAGDLQVDPSVAAKGWHLRTLYHPLSTQMLQDAKILTDRGGGGCDQIFGVGSVQPIWWPNLSVDQYASFRKCNVVSLRDKANPFSWTTVDPDCGLVDPATSASVVCKKRATRYLVRELGRDSDLQ